MEGLILNMSRDELMEICDEKYKERLGHIFSKYNKGEERINVRINQVSDDIDSNGCLYLDLLGEENKPLGKIMTKAPCNCKEDLDKLVKYVEDHALKFETPLSDLQ